MSGQELVEVIKQRPLGPDMRLLRLLAPDTAPAARAGQFVMLHTSPGRDPLLARPFSIHQVERDELHILYRVVGRGTRLLAQARPGQELELWGPLGRGFGLDHQRPLLVAGGVGVAALALAARQAKAGGARPRMLLGLATARGLGGLLDYLEFFLAGLGVSLELTSEDGSRGQPGLVSDLLARRLADCDGVLACGPLPMLKAVAGLAGQAGVECQVSLEAPMACGVGACLGCALPRAGGGYLRVCREGPVVEAGLVDWQRL